MNGKMKKFMVEKYIILQSITADFNLLVLIINKIFSHHYIIQLPIIAWNTPRI